MSLTKKVMQTSETKLTSASKVTTLNPNAAEFVPFAFRSSSSPGSTSKPDSPARVTASSGVGKAKLDRTELSVANNSDDEAHQYWDHQLPDDITPDFKLMTEDDSQGLGGLSLAGLSLHDGSEALRFASTGGYGLADQQELHAHHMNGNSLSEKIRYPASSTFLPWENQVMNNDQLLINGKDGHLYNGNSGQAYINDMIGERASIEDSDVNPVEFLASQFPGFAAESLAEVYVANGCDLNLTIEMLTQLELQVDSGFEHNLTPNTLPAPNLSAMDFPALAVPESQTVPTKFNGNDLQQGGNPYRSSEKDNLLMFKSSSFGPSRGPVDFASAVRKLASQDSGMWKYEGNGSVDSSVGSSRNSHLLASAYNSTHGRNIYADKLSSRGSGRAAPVWVETGDAVANMYSELREEARDHARLRNAYFEQARQAYLIGNKALAKELSVKGQLYNVHMKAAHRKAQEAIYRHRNPAGPENGRGHERMIDLHGLHVSEAIHVLKHELSVLRSTARAADQRLQVYICVGTGHHTRGSRTPARLPVSVQRYLLEEEGLDYSEPQPGMLRVVIY